jgi:hypothetical protein
MLTLRPHNPFAMRASITSASCIVLVAVSACISADHVRAPRLSAELLGLDAAAICCELGPPCAQAPCDRDANVWWYYCDYPRSSEANSVSPCSSAADRVASSPDELAGGGFNCRTPNFFAVPCADAKIVMHFDSEGRVDAVTLPSAAPSSYLRAQAAIPARGVEATPIRATVSDARVAAFMENLLPQRPADSGQ